MASKPGVSWRSRKTLMHMKNNKKQQIRENGMPVSTYILYIKVLECR